MSGSAGQKSGSFKEMALREAGGESYVSVIVGVTNVELASYTIEWIYSDTLQNHNSLA